MAEEAPKTTTTTTTATQEDKEAMLHAEEVVVTDVELADKKENTTTATATTIVEKEKEEGPEEEPDHKKKPLVEKEDQQEVPLTDSPTATTTTTEDSKPSSNGGGDEKVPESGSFKEESTRVADLAESEKKALQELKSLIQHALNNHEFSAPSPNKEEKAAEPVVVAADNKEEEEKKEDQKPIIEEKQNSEPEQVQQPTKQDEEEAEKKKEGEKEEAAQPEVKETKVVAVEEKVTTTTTTTTATTSSVDDDGAKTVEAIEETVVAVSSSTEQQEGSAKEPEVAPKEEEQPKEAKEEEKQQEEKEASPLLPPEEVSIWGVPLLADDRSDVILLKFLRARDFKVKDAFTMIKNTIRWRKEFKIDELMEEDLGDDLDKAVYMHGFDKEGHPVCYNIYGEFQSKELYKKAFSDEEKRQKFLRWRIQFLERSIRKLDFNPGGISTIVQVNDLKNSPGPGKWELRQATKQALQLLQDNYPEFVAKQVFINVPWWYLAVNRMISPFLTQRTKSKFVFAGPSKSAETLLRYIAPEQLPVKYGGLSKDGEFGNTDAVTEIRVRPAAKHTVEFPVTENCLLTWELRVIGWEVSYGAEFVPNSESSYTVIIQKARRVASSEEPVLCNSYKIGEPGKVVLTIDNQSSKKKKLLYRLKTKPSSTD